MRAARVMSQAKINLALRVGAKDSRGYHEIMTVFQRIDLADEIVVRLGGRERSLDCAGPFLPAEGLGPVEKNLAFRAAELYASHNDWVGGFSIEITKNIPVGGGLGGGSADAAGVLRAIDALASRPLGVMVLPDLAEQLGADVSFLVSDEPTAYAEGDGSSVVPLDPLGPKDALLVAPDFGISTADAYRWIDEAGGGTWRPLPPDHTPLSMPELVDWESMVEQSHNDFERVVERRYPRIREIRERLTAVGAFIARLSGSGSTVFGLFDESAPALSDFGAGARVIRSRTSARVVEVEVLQ